MYRDGISVESGWHWETKSTTEYMSDKDNVIREYWDSQRCTSVYIYREKLQIMKHWYQKILPKLNTGGEKLLLKGMQMHLIVFNKFMINSFSL